MIEIENLCFAYPASSQPVLQGVNLSIPRNKTLVLLGGSGSGKSTILRCLLKLVQPQQGTITVDEDDISTLPSFALRRRFGVVFQGNTLFPTLNVAENIALPMKVSHYSKSEIASRIEELLELINLPAAHYATRYPHQLSGGEQQRVGVARALATRPSYLLMDEPFGALDAITRRMLQEELKTIRTKLGITILFVTHDVMEAFMLGDHIAVLHQGRLLQSGPGQLLLNHPAHPVVANLIGSPAAEMRQLWQEQAGV